MMIVLIVALVSIALLLYWGDRSKRLKKVEPKLEGPSQTSRSSASNNVEKCSTSEKILPVALKETTAEDQGAIVAAITMAMKLHLQKHKSVDDSTIVAVIMAAISRHRQQKIL
jgi:hypothetical protein